MEEIIRIGKAENIKLDDDILQNSLEKIEKFPYETKTSFQRDFETPGKRDERDLFGNTLFKLSKKHKVEIPEIERTYNNLISR